MASKQASGLISFDQTEREGWVRAQKIAFTAWMNYQLSQSADSSSSSVNDLFADLSSGVLLIQLLEFLSGKPCPKRYSTNPKMKVQCTDNLGIFMDFLKDLQIRTENIGPQDIFDGNQNIILGLIWTLILRFGGGRAKSSPEDPSSTTEDNSAGTSSSDSASLLSSSAPKLSDSRSSSEQHTSIDKHELLEWCNQHCNPYGVLLDNFTSSWADGRGFSALVSSLTPLHQFSDDIPCPEASLQESFDHVRQAFAIPPMLVPELMVSPYSPDERSVITYLSAIRARCQDLPPIAPPDASAADDPADAQQPLEFDVSGDGLKDAVAGTLRTVRVAVSGAGADAGALRLRVVGEDGRALAVRSSGEAGPGVLEFTYTAERAEQLRVEGYYEDELIFEQTAHVAAAAPHRFELRPLQDVASVGSEAAYALAAFDAFSNEVPVERLAAELSAVVTLQDRPERPLPASLTVCDAQGRVSFLPAHTGVHEVALVYQGRQVAASSIVAREEDKHFRFTAVAEAPRVSEPCECRLRQSVGGNVVALSEADLAQFKVHTSAPVTDLLLSIDPETGELVCTCTPVEKGELEIRVLCDGALAAASTVAVLASPPVSFQFEAADEAPAVKQKLSFEIVAQDAQSHFTDFDTTKVGLIITDPQGNTVAHEFDPSRPIAESLSGSFTPQLSGEYTAKVFYDAAEISSVAFTVADHPQAAEEPSTPKKSHHRKRHHASKKHHHSKRHSKHREKDAPSASACSESLSDASEPSTSAPSTSSAPEGSAESANRVKAKLLRVYFGDDPVSQMATLSHTFKSVPYTAETTCSEVLEHIVKLIKKVLPITQHPELIRTLNNLTYSLIRVRGDSAVCIPASHFIQEWIERIISEEADLRMTSLISHDKHSTRPTLPSQPTADALPGVSSAVLLKKALKSKAAAKFLLTQPRRVTVTLEAGRSLASKDSNGKSDPYCKLLLNNQQFTSSVVSHSLDPVWKKQVFEFGVRNLTEAELYLETWDHDIIGSHDFMGYLKADLTKLEFGVPSTQWIALLPRQGKNDIVSGEIKLTFLYTDVAGASSQTKLKKHSKKHASGVKLSRKQVSQLAAQQSHRLVVTVIDGSDLAAKDSGGTSDPYVSVEVFHQTFKTKRVDKSLNPVWNETLTFGVPEIHSGMQLIANVWDWDAVGKHDFMGQVIIPLGEFQGGESVMSGTYKLQPREGRNDKISGQILLKIEYQKDLDVEPQTKIFFAPAPQIPFSVSTTYPSLKVKVGDPILIRLELRMVADKSLCNDLFGGELCGCFTLPDGTEISIPATKSPAIVTDLDRAKEAGKYYVKYLPTMPGKLTSIVRYNGAPMQRKSAVFHILPGKRTVNIR